MGENIIIMIGDFVVDAQFSNPMYSGGINSLDIDPIYGTKVIGGTENGCYFCYDLSRNQEIYSYRLKHPAAITDVAVLKTDGGIFCTTSVDGHLRIYDIKNARKSAQMTDCHCIIRSVSAAPDAPVVVVGLEEGSTRIFDLRQSVNLNALKTGYDTPVSIAQFSNDNSFLVAVGDALGRLFLFDLRNPKVPYQLDWYRAEITDKPETYVAHGSEINCIQFSPNSRTFLSLDKNGVIREWSSDTGLSELNEYRITEYKRSVRRMKIAYTSKTIFAPSENSVYDILEDKKNIGHISTVNGVFENNGSLISYGEDNLMTIWKKKDAVSFVDDKSDWSDE